MNGADPGPLSPDEVSRRAGVDRESVERWAGLGLLVRSGDGALAPDSVERARVVRLAVRRGMTEDQIAAASEREGDVLGRFVRRVTTATEEPITLDEAAARAGLDPSFARRMRSASGLPDDDVTTDDVAAMQAAATALAVGLPEDALLQLLRVFADALGRIADTETRLFHFHVHDRLRAAGHRTGETIALAEQATDALLELVEPTLLYFHRKAMARAMREDVLVHLAEDVTPSPSGELAVAVLFVDLAGYAALTEAMGDEAAAVVLDRFSELVRDEALHCDGRVVKQIGDEFMLVFPDPRTAVGYAVHLAESASGEHDFPALRMGAHSGNALYREADYLGATVNIAARAVAEAQRGELVVTGPVSTVAEDLVGSWRALGGRRLKGIQHPVELYVADLASASFPVDPVCGMAVDPQRAVVGDDGHRFCSVACRDRYRVQRDA